MPTMQHTRPITLRGQAIAGGKLPLVCTPLVGRTPAQLLAELALVLPKQPDVLEWRVDFFESIRDTAKVISTLNAIKSAANGTPLLFTRRAVIEGGEPIALTEPEVMALYAAVCQSQLIDLIDYELAHGPELVAQVREAAKANGVALVLSYHNFSFTPSADAIREKLLLAEQLGADVAKVAVMPRELEDVLTLLSATLAAHQQSSIPLISMSMGPHGALTRLFGWVFGSALTFAVGASSSAPGQVPIEDLNAVMQVLHRTMRRP
jgi:3-dehydroquinate dehydratase-1